MLKNLSLSLIVVFIVCAAFVIPQSNEKLLYYDNNVKLKWSDFKASPDPEASVFASSYLGFSLGYKGTARQDSLIVVVESFFNRDISWYKDDTTAYNLQHEQTHFDITELYSRKLKQSIQGATLTYKNYQSVMRELEKKAHADMNTADSIYETVTDFSRNKIEQKKWNDNIAADLKNLSGFAADTFKVAVRL